MARSESTLRGALPKLPTAGVVAAIEHRMDALRAEAEACAADGDTAGACALLLRLVRLQSERFGDADGRTLATRLDLANQLHAAGAYESAQRQYDKALLQYREILGEDDPDLLILRFTRAQTLLRSGDLIGARQILEAVDRESKSLLGDRHPATLVYTDLLAATLVRLGELETAKTIVLDLLKARAAGSSAEDAAGSLATASVLVTRFIDNGAWADAVPVQEQVSVVLQTLRGRNDLESLRAISLLALTLLKSGQIQRARALVQSIASPLAAVLGRSHIETLNLFSLLAALFTRAEELVTARAILERSYGLAEDVEIKHRLGTELVAVLRGIGDAEAVRTVIAHMRSYGALTDGVPSIEGWLQ